MEIFSLGIGGVMAKIVATYAVIAKDIYNGSIGDVWKTELITLKKNMAHALSDVAWKIPIRQRDVGFGVKFDVSVVLLQEDEYRDIVKYLKGKADNGDQEAGRLYKILLDDDSFN